MENYFDLLLSSPLFAGVSRSELSAMLGCLGARTLTAAKGSPVFLEGDPAGFVGVVLEGRIQVVRDDFYGTRSLLMYADTGEVFAEAFACANVAAMPVSAYAQKDSRVMLLDCRKMLTVCSNSCGFHHRLVRNLLQMVAEKSLMLSNKIRFMSQKTTRDKLMSYLLEQAKLQGSPSFTIPLDRQSLADYLGVERSAMSTELSKLRKDGVLESKGAWFHLLEQDS